MKKKSLTTQAVASKSGLVLSPDGSGYAVDWMELPASDHFFLATSSHLRKAPTGLRILFGTASSFEESSEHYDLAAEIHFPIHEARLYLYQSIFIEMSGNGKTTFYNSVTDALVKLKVNPSEIKPETIKKLPVNKQAAFRIFPANFAAVSFSGTQALVEFFEVTPDLILFLTKRSKMRPFSGVKPVISIILDTVTLLRFMNSCKDVLAQPIPQEANK